MRVKGKELLCWDEGAQFEKKIRRGDLRVMRESTLFVRSDLFLLRRSLSGECFFDRTQNSL